MREHWLDPPEYAIPICPICGEECEEIKRDYYGKVCGCDNCITSEDAREWAVMEEIDEEASYGDYLYDMRRDLEMERRHGDG